MSGREFTCKAKMKSLCNDKNVICIAVEKNPLVNLTQLAAN